MTFVCPITLTVPPLKDPTQRLRLKFVKGKCKQFLPHLIMGMKLLSGLLNLTKNVTGMTVNFTSTANTLEKSMELGDCL